MTSSHCVIPAVLELGVIAPVSQTMETKPREGKAVFPKRFHATIENDTELHCPGVKDKALEGGDDVGPTQPSQACGPNVMAHLESIPGIAGTRAGQPWTKGAASSGLGHSGLTGASPAKCILLEQSPRAR